MTPSTRTSASTAIAAGRPGSACLAPAVITPAPVAPPGPPWLLLGALATRRDGATDAERVVLWLEQALDRRAR